MGAPYIYIYIYIYNISHLRVNDSVSTAQIMCCCRGKKYEMSGKTLLSPTSACILQSVLQLGYRGLIPVFYTVYIFLHIRTEGTMGPTKASPGEATHFQSVSGLKECVEVYRHCSILSRDVYRGEITW